MAHWNTLDIMRDLSTIVGVVEIVKTDCGGDYDTDNLVIKLGGVEDELFICGFDPDVSSGMEPDRSEMDVEFVELTDGLQSDHGLSSSDYQLARAYIDVRQYFINRGFEVVDSMDAYF